MHVCHKGYPSLLPLCLGLLPVDSPKLKAILDDIEDEKQFWSPYGLRSLSASDEFYNTGEIYWRGPIWININYLTLQSLYNVSKMILKRSFIFRLTVMTTELYARGWTLPRACHIYLHSAAQEPHFNCVQSKDIKWLSLGIS